jgi:dihydropteroate synthase
MVRQVYRRNGFVMGSRFFSFGSRKLNLTEPRVMGVVNVTPDSFSDGGRFLSLDAALNQAELMVTQGAALIDVGGESTRPGAEPVSLQQELDRVCPVVEALSGALDVIISVDTSAPQVMAETIRLGAGLINDVRAFSHPDAFQVVANKDVAICLMHMRGTPKTMQEKPEYESVLTEVLAFLDGRIKQAALAGIDPDRIIVDPGFGFGKSLDHNLQLLANVREISNLGCPVLVGMSRKSMLGLILDKPVDQRKYGGIAAATIAALGGAAIIRTHDVLATVDAMKIVTAVTNSRDKYKEI